MYLRISAAGPGIHRNESVVAIETINSEERVLIDKRALKGDLIEIGAPLRVENDRALVELPRETMSGAWRVWVPVKNLQLSAKAA